MKLNWSHAVLNVHNLDKMLDFYTTTMGFKVSDRGPLGDNGPDIVFMSQSEDEHHQLAMAETKKDDAPSNSLNHLAFRVESFGDVKEMNQRLSDRDVEILPLSHGNTLSLYFNDPEGNGIEVFWDTPWHVAQPQAIVWDTSLNETEALTFVEDSFKNEPSFQLREECQGEFVNR